MDVITSSVLSGIIYDMLKKSVILSAENLKQRLGNWLIETAQVKQLEVELAKLNVNDQMSEKAIEASIASSEALTSILGHIERSNNNTINQNHTGVGDNIATINHK